MARLLQTAYVIHQRGRADRREVQSVARGQGQIVRAVDQDEAARAQLLVIITRYRERKFRSEREHAPNTIGAEAVRVDAGSRRDAQHEVVLVRQRVCKQSASPK